MGSAVTRARAKSRASRGTRSAVFSICLAAGFAALTAATSVRADSDPLQDLLTTSGAAGVGLALREERSLYRDGGVRNDLLPLYLYEGEHFYLHAYRAGLKFNLSGDNRLDVFLSHRFEGYPSDRVPASLTGMSNRSAGLDLGLSLEHKADWGKVYAEYLHDVSGTSSGNELKLGYAYEWANGRLKLKPYFTLSARDAKLNDYYYGVRPEEAIPGRPAYSPGAGFNAEAGMYATYNLTERWRALAGVWGTRWSSGVRGSPIVDDRLQLGASLGLLYDFSPAHQDLPDHPQLIVKALYGKSTDCNLLPIMGLSCTSTTTSDNTRIAGLEVGRPFVQRLNGWPLDFVGYLGAIRHDENGLQDNFWEGVAFMKAYFYGFPWSDHVRTRLGFGVGLSYAQEVPFVEQRSQAERGRTTSKLLNYLDPSIDISLGDMVGSKRYANTFFGFGVSHRSGIFGSSELFGNVDGGSNYIYSYLEFGL
jgi:outer membrane protein